MNKCSNCERDIMWNSLSTMCEDCHYCQFKIDGWTKELLSLKENSPVAAARRVLSELEFSNLKNE